MDTGAMYRAIAYHCLEKGIEIDNYEAVKSELSLVNIDCKLRDSGCRIILNGEDVTDKIRTQEVSQASSKVAAINEVRLKLVEIQRNIASANNVVMDGRDIGSNVLPNAQLKIYLYASLEKRTQRRLLELKSIGCAADYETTMQQIAERDHRDINRECSPLTVAKDAIRIDSSELDVTEIVERILKIIM